MAAQTDRIEKKILLRAPLDRVWRAISDAKEFGSWFGVEFDGVGVPKPVRVHALLDPGPCRQPAQAVPDVVGLERPPRF